MLGEHKSKLCDCENCGGNMSDAESKLADDTSQMLGKLAEGSAPARLTEAADRYEWAMLTLGPALAVEIGRFATEMIQKGIDPNHVFGSLLAKYLAAIGGQVAGRISAASPGWTPQKLALVPIDDLASGLGEMLSRMMGGEEDEGEATVAEPKRYLN